MRPRVIFPDAMKAALAILRAEPLLDGVTFGTKPLDVTSETAPSVPYAAVRLAATFPRYPVGETATLRVSVWAATDAEGLALAQRVRAVLLAHPGNGDVRSFGPLTGPVPTEDPDTRGPLSYFTVAARLRPQPL